MEVIGKSVIRKEAIDKLTGWAMYTNDFHMIPMLSGQMLISPYGHARMPGALGNALSVAAGVSLHNLPLIPELIWRTKGAIR